MNRKYVYKENAQDDHYHADIFAVRCFDNRFWKIFKHFVRHIGLGHLDPESVAGGAKIFASPEKAGDRDFMLRELEKSIKLHHTKRVMLFTHSDCGAYGGLSKFGGNKDKEFSFHKLELKKAKSAVKSKFTKLKIETYFIDKEGVVLVK